MSKGEGVLYCCYVVLDGAVAYWSETCLPSEGFYPPSDERVHELLQLIEYQLVPPKHVVAYCNLSIGNHAVVEDTKKP